MIRAPLSKAKPGVPIWNDKTDLSTGPFPSLIRGVDLFQLPSPLNSQDTLIDVTSKILIAINPPSTVYIALHESSNSAPLEAAGWTNVKNFDETGDDDFMLSQGLKASLYTREIYENSVTLSSTSGILTIFVDEGNKLLKFKVYCKLSKISLLYFNLYMQ